MSTILPSGDLGLSWRPLTEGDLPAWHQLVAVIEDADAASERHTAEDLLDELLEGSWKNPADDSLLGIDPHGVPRAFGHVEVRPGDVRSVRAFCWGGVHPQWRNRGVGHQLLAWQEALGREKIAAAGKDVPGRILVYAEEHQKDLRRLLEDTGFHAVRWYVEMSRPVDGADEPIPDVGLEEGLRLVPYEAALSEPVRLAHNESFAGHWGSEPRAQEDWERFSVGHRGFRPDWSFVVLDAGAVAGYTLTSAYEQDWPARGYRCGWTDLLGVRPAWRGRRLAPALLTAAMQAMAASGMERADLGVDSENTSGALGLYTRLGYVPCRRTVAYAKDV